MDFDPQKTITRIERELGRAPRNASFDVVRHLLRDRPEWATGDDLIRRIYDEGDEIVHRGEPRWCTIIHANTSVFSPGPNTSGAQVLYDADGEAPLEFLGEIASRCFELKANPRSGEEPAAVRLGQMLADEMERALDWPIPETVSYGVDLYTTIVMLPRQSMPQGFLALKSFPILADPVTRMAVFVPGRYWDRDFLAWWRAEAEKVVAFQKNEAHAWRDLVARRRPTRSQRPKRGWWSSFLFGYKEPPRATAADGRGAGLTIDRSRFAPDVDPVDETPLPVTLTRAAADRILEIVAQQELDDLSWCVRIGRFDFKFEARPGPESGDIAYEYLGVPLVIDEDAVGAMAGVTIDFREQGGEMGFTFD